MRCGRCGKDAEYVLINKNSGKKLTVKTNRKILTLYICKQCIEDGYTNPKINTFKKI